MEGREMLERFGRTKGKRETGKRGREGWSERGQEVGRAREERERKTTRIKE